MLDTFQFRNLIVNPVLSKLQAYSDAAEELLVFTCAAESLGGTYIHQIKGPAMGVYQMEPNTHTDIWINFINNRNRLTTLLALHFDCNRVPQPERLIYDLNYSTAMTRIHYLRVKGALPDKSDVDGMWNYYKQHYNTPKGKAEKADTIAKYEKFVQS